MVFFITGLKACEYLTGIGDSRLLDVDFLKSSGKGSILESGGGVPVRNHRLLFRKRGDS